MRQAQRPTDELIPLADATDRAIVGGKATGLARARAAGHLVPDGVVLPVGAAVPNDGARWELVAGLVERLGGSVAVRSSAVEEDSADASYAGQYESVLNITDDDQLVAAIRHCRASAESAAVHSYAEHVHAGDGGVAVIVQRSPSSSSRWSTPPLLGWPSVSIR